MNGSCINNNTAGTLFAKVVIADFSDRGKSISEELNAKGHDTLFVKTDVTNEDQNKLFPNSSFKLPETSDA